MKKNDKLNDTLSKLLPIVLFLVGITLCGRGIAVLSAQSGYQEVEAVITEINVETYSVGGREKSVSTAAVSFTLEGVSYSSELSGVRRGFVKGASVTVLVDPLLPENVILPQTAGGVVQSVLGAVLLLIGLILFVPLLRAVFSAESKKREELYVDSGGDQDEE